MGIFKALTTSWKAATTAEKINLVLDIICGFGGGAMSAIVGRDLAVRSGSKLAAKITIPITACGLGMAAGNAASKALMEGIGTPLANVIDRVQAKNKKEEESEDGNYTRY